MVLLSQYDIGLRTPEAIKSQAIVDLLAQFPREEESSLSEEISGEVAVADPKKEMDNEIRWVSYNDLKWSGSCTKL